MKRFLSIDWDFFIDADMTQRCTMFPDGGNENLPDSLRDYIWDSRYRIPALREIGLKEYKSFQFICKTFKGHAFVADSHKWMYDFVIENTEPDEEFEVYNIDFHHDLYNFRTSGGEVNCGNWATLLLRDRPKMRYKWVKCDTSDLNAGDEEVKCEKMTMAVLSMLFPYPADSFEYLFICRSAVWSPPHLDPKFIKAVKTIKCPLTIEQGLLKPRPYEVPGDFDELKVLCQTIMDSKKSQ